MGLSRDLEATVVSEKEKKMNVKLLRKIEKHILAEPKRFWMRWFVAVKDGIHKKLYTRVGTWRAYPKCNTAACVAGWACILSGKKVSPNQHLSVLASDILGLDPDQAARLFVPQNWPRQFHAGIRDDGKKETVKTAVARIEHFIRTKGKE